MLVPLISAAIGLLLLIFGSVVYRGWSALGRFPVLTKLEDNLFFLWGMISISLAAMLGMAGYWNIFRGDDLRLGRIVLLLLGSAITLWAILETWGENNPLRQLGLTEKLKKLGNLKVISYGLTGVAVLTLISIFLVAFSDYNYGGDAFMYHIPFAARLWNIIPPQQYQFEFFTENRFLGFPLLANWLQGLFWVTFHRIEATNLVAYSSLIIFLVYLVRVAKIPFYLATLSLLAVPMIHMHAARSYIDLPANLAVSIFILTLYLLYIKRLILNRNTLLILFFSAFAAANIKLQIIPVIFLLVFCALPIFIQHYWQPAKPRPENIQKMLQVFLGLTLAGLIIFYNPIKNIILYQNPGYPIKISLAGHVLNHTEGSPDFMHPNIRKMPPPLRWGRSVLEIDAFDARRPWPWTLAMDFISWNEERFGLGGYFGGYVIFNVILLGTLVWKDWQRETQDALILMVLMTGVTVWLPQSYELRYYMYWMIVFVSLNAYLVTRYAESHLSLRNPLKPQYFGLVSLVFMLIFIDKTGKFFTYPAFQPLTQQLSQTEMLDKKILDEIKPGDQVCIVGKAPNTFFYNSYFHPEKAQYSVRGEFTLDDKWVSEKCEGRKVLR